MRFENKIAFVSGGTKGIGKEIVKNLLLEGAVVFTCYKSDEKAKSLLLEEVLSENLKVYKADVSKKEDIQNIYLEIKQDFGRLDILINNAGRHEDSLFLDMEDEAFSSVFDLNFKSVVLCSCEALELLNNSEAPSILNMVSISGIHGRIGQANYSASKGAIIGFTKLFAKLHPKIRTNALAPGMIETEMTEDVSSEKFSEVVKACNIKRAGTPKEVASSTLFFSSPEASYFSGSVFCIDGGFLK